MDDPRPLWAVLEALGACGSAPVAETMVDERRLSDLMTTVANSIVEHWNVLAGVPTVEVLQSIERILDRYDRRIRH